MKRCFALLLIMLTLICCLCSCGMPKEPSPAEDNEAAAQTPAANETGSAEAAGETSAPEAAYDARSETLTLKGFSDYSQITLPDEVYKARALEAENAAFTLSVYLPALRKDGWDEKTELPAMLERTLRSLEFLRGYLKENAGEAYPARLAELPVRIKIDGAAVGYETDGKGITLRYFDAGTHREFLYLLALQDGGAVGWEQIGFAWYVGTCIDPYSEMADGSMITPELDYYELCAAAGVEPESMEPRDILTVYDAVSRISIERGLTHWGSACESLPVTCESVFTRTEDEQPGDSALSAFMAASFLGWLNEAHGFEKLSLFCFGKLGFEDAFGTDFSSAFEAWKAWITDTYPYGEANG